MSTLIIGFLLLLLALAGVPLFSIVAGIGIIAFNAVGIDTAAMTGEFYRLASFPSLIAVPLFTFAGFVLAESQAPRRLVDVILALFGWLPGGPAIAAVLATSVFTAFTGASGVTIVAMGGLLYPALVSMGFPERFSLGLVTTSGSLGLLLPPSLAIILYGLVAKVDIGSLFLGGIVPEVLLVLLLVAYCIGIGRRTQLVRTPFSWAALQHSLRASGWEIALPIFVLGGIYGGVITATEAATIAAAYAVVVEVVIRKELSLTGDLPRVIRESMIVFGTILVMLGCAVGVTNYLVDQEVPQAMFAFVNQHIGNKVIFLLLLNLLLLIVNMLEVFSAIIMIVPLIVPMAISYGMSPLHLGIMFLLNLEIGYMIPPLAPNIFLSSLRFEKPLPEVYRAVVPFLVLLLLLLLVVTFVPELSLVVPDLAFANSTR
jgi:tripartite ATP-independent transporter DctM subunit